MLGTGQGIPRDDAAAALWYRKAAEQGHAGAQHHLGSRNLQGLGVPKDSAQAAHWYRKAAEQGDRESQYNLGVMCAAGEGVSRDDAEAVAWYRKAAEQNHAAAQSNLGVMFECGRGVPKDVDQARYWYQLAADQGNVPAQNNLKRLNESKLPAPPAGSEKLDDTFSDWTSEPEPRARDAESSLPTVDPRINMLITVKILHDPTVAARAVAKEIERIAIAAGFHVVKKESVTAHDADYTMHHHPSRIDVAQSLAGLLRGVRHGGREIEVKSGSYVGQDLFNVWVWGNWP